MRRRTAARPIVAGALVLAATAATARAQTFEGVVHATVNAAERTQEVVYTIKGDRLRMDMTAGPGMEMAMIFDRPASKTLMVMPARQMYMERQLDTAQMKATPEGMEGVIFKWTGNKETIAGYECEHALVTDRNGEQMDICIAKGMGPFFAQPAMRRGRAAAGSEWQRLVSGGFPLKVQKVGEASPIFTVTRIEKRAVDDAQFTVPASFTKMDMPMMQ